MPSQKIKIIAWNVNGLRSVHGKSILSEYLTLHDPDIMCMGETKLSYPDVKAIETMKSIPQYEHRYYATSRARQGYSGTTIWSKIKPINVVYGVTQNAVESYRDTLTHHQEHIVENKEGRIITLEFEQYFLVHCYVPNSGEVLQRLEYRVKQWDPIFQHYLDELQKKKHTVVCGDFNCAHHEIDIHAPKRNLKSAGFTVEERTSFSKYIKDLSMVDTFRCLHPKAHDQYTYWSYRGRARTNNRGWRIDYFLTSSKFFKNVMSSSIHADQLGSDHAPIELVLSLDRNDGGHAGEK